MMNEVFNWVKNKKIFYGTLIIIILVIFNIGLFFFDKFSQIPKSTKQITNFKECAQAGYPVGESHPRQCWTPDGGYFIEEITNSEKYYGSSTYSQCQINKNCFISGCNFEICQSRAEEPIITICIIPNKPVPKQLNYECQCVNQKCQWFK